MYGDEHVGRKLDFIIAELLEQRARQFAIATYLTHMEHRIMTNLDTITQQAGRIAADVGQIGTALDGVSTDITKIADLLKNNPTEDQLASAAQVLTTAGDNLDTVVASIGAAKTSLDALANPGDGAGATG